MYGLMNFNLNLTKFKKPYIATPHIAGKTMSAENKFNEKALTEFNNFFNENLEAIEPERFIEFTVDNSIEEEMDVLWNSAFYLPKNL